MAHENVIEVKFSADASVLKSASKETAEAVREVGRAGGEVGDSGEACQRVAKARARTLAGMLAKLAFVAGNFDGDEEREPAEWGTSGQILFSVAVDFGAITRRRRRRRIDSAPA
jgi:hypothetical protein